MQLIIGLGNPGTEYSQTRHNIGFMVIDKIAQKLELKLRFDATFNAKLATYTHAGELYIFAQPQTFMNRSGEAVQRIADFYKIAPPYIYVVHDDLDLELGSFKLTSGQNAAGHHGIESVIEQLGTRDFQRLRVGIADNTLRQLRTLPKDAGRDERIGSFALSDFSDADQTHLTSIIDQLLITLGTAIGLDLTS